MKEIGNENEQGLGGQWVVGHMKTSIYVQMSTQVEKKEKQRASQILPNRIPIYTYESLSLCISTRSKTSPKKREMNWKLASWLSYSPPFPLTLTCYFTYSLCENWKAPANFPHNTNNSNKLSLFQHPQQQQKL